MKRANGLQAESYKNDVQA